MATMTKAKKSTKKTGPERIYPEPKTVLYLGEEGMTAEMMKEIIGWCESEEEAHAAGVIEPTLTDLLGNRIWLLKNKGNRPFDMAHCMRLSQDVIQGKWRWNGEAIAIGEYGNFVSGQHRGPALILAEQRRTLESEKAHWKKIWPEPIKIDMQVNFGVKEDQDTKNTIDNVKARTLSDVLYGSGMFDDVKNSQGQPVSQGEEKTLCRMTDYAVRFLWERTGAKKNPYSPHRTHSESMEFLEDHPSVKKAVSFIWTEYGGDQKVNNQRMPAGTAAGLMYLMAASDTEPAKYQKVRKEKSCDLSKWEKAEDFWVQFCSPDGGDLAMLRKILGQLSDGENDNTAISAEKIGTVCKAWNLFAEDDVEGLKSRKRLTVKRTQNEFGIHVITDDAIDVVGIDKGPYKPKKEKEEPEADEKAGVEERKAQVRKERAAKEEPAPEPEYEDHYGNETEE